MEVKQNRVTRTPYRLLTLDEDVVEVLQHILQLREEEDIPDFTNITSRLTRGDIFSTMADTTTASIILATTTYHMDVDATSGVITVTLEPSPVDGQTHSVAKTDAGGNAVTVSGNGKNINGSATSSLASQYDTEQYIFIADNDEWRII